MSSDAAEPSTEGVPALFSWGDIDGDGRLDLAAVTEGGALRLLANTGDGRFEDVTGRVGLAEVGNVALAAWADYDGDGWLDLFVGARLGSSRLFRNVGGAFVDMSAASGLAIEGAVQFAQWLDHDGDGRFDLFVVTAQESAHLTRVFRGLAGGFFERVELPFADEWSAPELAGFTLGVAGVDPADAGGPELPSIAGARRERSTWASGLLPGSPSRGIRAVVGSSTGGPVPATIGDCAASIQDEANPGARCLGASATPLLGRLYPLSTNLFVALDGNVGIGTTSPTAKLDVAGTARMTGTLTLAPLVDKAVDVSTGSIYKGGELFVHTKGGVGNTAMGVGALANTTTGRSNSAVGDHALAANTSGFFNCAVGDRALAANTGGFSNTAFGNHALFSTTVGTNNTATGNKALYANRDGGSNTAIGSYALRDNTTGGNNTAVGVLALLSNRTGGANSATGSGALRFNTSGFFNTATGNGALYQNTNASYNTANGALALRANTTGQKNEGCGFRALYSNTTGSRNIAVGAHAGQNLTTGSDNIAIGNRGVAGEGATIRIGAAEHARTFLAGIHGVTTGVADAIPVVVDSAGQLGTISSSRRLKRDIRDMGDATERLLELRPVLFHYKQEQELPSGGEVPFEYGLIAEEVAEIFPDLVVYDEGGQPLTVKYHLLSSMLLNELKRLEAAHARQLAELRSEVETRLAAVEARTTRTVLDGHALTEGTATRRE